LLALCFNGQIIQYLGNVPVNRASADTPATTNTGNSTVAHGVELKFMTYLLPYPSPFFFTRVFHWHLGIDGKGTAIPTPESRALLLNQFIINVKTVTGGTHKSTYTTTYTLISYLLPVFFFLKASQ
jgi:hypothetical protein